jgi:hypothetical protein
MLDPELARLVLEIVKAGFLIATLVMITLLLA